MLGVVEHVEGGADENGEQLDQVEQQDRPEEAVDCIDELTYEVVLARPRVDLVFHVDGQQQMFPLGLDVVAHDAQDARRRPSETAEQHDDAYRVHVTDHASNEANP